MDKYYLKQIQKQNATVSNQLQKISNKQQIINPKLEKMQVIHDIKENDKRQKYTVQNDQLDQGTFQDAFNTVFPEMANDPMLKFSSFDKRDLYQNYELKFGDLPDE
ncbi:Hypothetical_protein [Hexamita inflata]|uniref:Hypothetical_protein n=1 Tax=Hexamita inflata TaxID=28002 RepID=A0AA86QKW2_9EUKA|nr:Hypothetical protein HINF_LOCUS41245 [Hexamita inflata]